MEIAIIEVEAQTAAYAELLDLAGQLAQAQYIPVQETYIDESIMLGAFVDQRCVGFLRLLIQVIGRDRGRPPLTHAGQLLHEGYVEAFGVAPASRRQGIGQRLQERAMALCQQRHCYQLRSRSPITSHANYALKLKLGFAVHPSADNDSYYFIKTLADRPASDHDPRERQDRP